MTSVTFTGTLGTIYVNRGKFSLMLDGVQKAKFTDNKTDKPALAAQLDAVENEFLASPYFRLYHSDDHKADWLTCIRSRKRPIADAEVGARTVTVCHLANLAYRYGQRLLWNPLEEQFAAGTGNPKWLDLTYHGHWKLS